MNISDSLKEWLKTSNLELYQLLNIAFVPRRTAEDILGPKEYPSIAARQRLHNVTKLDEFKLTPTETVEYEKLKSSNTKGVDDDEKISERFLKLWREENLTPSKEDSLMLTVTRKQDKKELTHLLLERYFNTNSKPKRQKVAKHNGADREPLSLLSTISKALRQETERELRGEKISFDVFWKNNGEELKKLCGVLNILMDGNPQKAYQQLMETKKMLA